MSSENSYDAFRRQSLNEPLQTIIKRPGCALAILHLTKFRTDAIGHPITGPAPTVTAGTSKRPGGNGHVLGIAEAALTPFLAGNGGSEYQAKPRPLDRPAHIILKQSCAYPVALVIARQFGASAGHRVDEPSATITVGGGGKSQLVAPTLIQMDYGERPGQEPRVLRLDNPLGTVTAGGNKFTMVSVFLAKHYGGNYTGPGASMDEPAHSVTTVDHHTAVVPHLVKLRGICHDGQHLDVSMPTIAAGGQHVSEVRTLLKTYCEESDDEWLVMIDGVKYQIVDIGTCTSQPYELYKMQGFPGGYVIDQDYRGNHYTKDKQVARCGNAVPPPFVRTLVEANLSEPCAVQQQEMTWNLHSRSLRT